MKYWARNGAWNWICNQSEYSERLPNSIFVEVKKTYMVTSFWNNYDGNKTPIDGELGSTGGNVDGKGGAKAYGDFGQQN